MSSSLKLRQALEAPGEALSQYAEWNGGIRVSTTGALIMLLALMPVIGRTCDVVIIGHKKVDVAAEIVRKADVIVRATAGEYFLAPVNRKGTIMFQVVEVIRGKDLPMELTLQGELVSKDDFNVHAPPYDVVRPNGLRGSCYAWQYRTGEQYLLMLKHDGKSLTPDWYALAPVNEQLHSPDDPWLLWVRAQVSQYKNAKPSQK
jgi:hypothetical protein